MRTKELEKLEMMQRKARELVEYYISVLKSSNNPTSLYSAALTLIMQSGLGQDLLDKLTAVYFEVIQNFVSQYGDIQTNNSELTEQHKLLLKCKNDFIFSFINFSKNLNEIEITHEWIHKHESLRETISKYPKSLEANKASDILAKDVSDKGFPEKVVKAYTDIEKLKEEKKELDIRFKNLKDLMPDNNPHNASILKDIETAVRDLGARIGIMESRLAASIKTLVQYHDAVNKNEEGASQEKVNDDLRVNISKNSPEHETKANNCVNELNNAPDNKSREEILRRFAERKTLRKDENITLTEAEAKPKPKPKPKPKLGGFEEKYLAEQNGGTRINKG
ncbi:hypothetical protein NF27_GG00070 [Candidatus Jidaibacter acanthamoeba]|uniref:Uncharacterized protein n=1 Tax=Candidatus Jidaibacter acanthamoebae TaxID=86105 RepID=A0A0C1MXR1_9RICK|nr:hypothetical protein [Candidatus Jidaibacter acanthamoeba]KIE04711.1 hypothetical protein NF27_GG00070 [Candidatus Jidaibacter acanthamoeba]